MMIPRRILRLCQSLAPFLLSTLLFLMLSASGYAETCITCHTDEDLLEENLGEAVDKKSPLQAGAG